MESEIRPGSRPQAGRRVGSAHPPLRAKTKMSRLFTCPQNERNRYSKADKEQKQIVHIYAS